MSYHFLTSGSKYRVTQAFADFDRLTHPVGEEWTFLRTTFLPYDDGLSIFVTGETGLERQIRMQWRDDEQGPIIDHLSDYIAPA